jgi:thioredoxin-related protein
MDATTYTDKDIIKLMNKYYYAVKLDAETRDTFYFNNHKFFNASPGQRGSVNELAYSLLDGKLEYPTTVYLDEKVNRLTYAAGYMSAADLKTVLMYFAEDKYKTLNFEAYKKSLTESSTK